MSERTAVRRKPRERIGADDARVWAREIRLRNPYAKAILLALANYMNEDGSCYPGLGTISRDTDISEDVVGKRLRWLEEIGAIAVFRCWRDDSGRRNYEGRGKPTSSEIRFLFDADRDEIEARAQDSANDRPLRGAARRSAERAAGGRGEELRDEVGETCEIPEISTRHGRGIQHPSSARVAPEQRPPVAGAETDVYITARARLELEQESQPQTPSQSEGAFDRIASRLAEFQEAYPIPVTDLVKAEMQWRGLTDEERSDAITGARGYASLLKAQPKRTAEDAHRWLRGRKWQGYLTAGKQAETMLRRWAATEADDHWQAWDIYYRICGFRGIPDYLITGTVPHRSANLPSEWPPVGRGLEPDRANWGERIEGSGQFAAWLRLLTSIENARVLFGQKIEGSRYLRTLRTPSEWPPGKAESSAA